MRKRVLYVHLPVNPKITTELHETDCTILINAFQVISLSHSNDFVYRGYMYYIIHISCFLSISLSNENLMWRFSCRIECCRLKDIFLVMIKKSHTLIKDDATRPRKICGRGKCALFLSAVSRKFLHILYLGHRANRAVKLWRSLRYWLIFTED